MSEGDQRDNCFGLSLVDHFVVTLDVSGSSVSCLPTQTSILWFQTIDRVYGEYRVSEVRPVLWFTKRT